VLDQAPGDRRCHQGLAVSRLPDGVQELLARGVLEEESAGPGAECSEDALVEVALRTSPGLVLEAWKTRSGSASVTRSVRLREGRP